MPYFRSKLSHDQVLQNSHDETNQALRSINLNSLVTDPWDYLSAAYPNGTTEVYTYKSGGVSGTTVATITVTYTDSTKANVSTVSRA